MRFFHRFIWGWLFPQKVNTKNCQMNECHIILAARKKRLSILDLIGSRLNSICYHSVEEQYFQKSIDLCSLLFWEKGIVWLCGYRLFPLCENHIDIFYVDRCSIFLVERTFILRTNGWRHFLIFSMDTINIKISFLNNCKKTVHCSQCTHVVIVSWSVNIELLCMI